MSDRIRVDTESLKRKAGDGHQIATEIEESGAHLYQKMVSLNDYGGQLPSKREGLKAQSAANNIRDQLKVSFERLRLLAGKFEDVDRETLAGFLPIPEPPLPTIFYVYPSPMNLNMKASDCALNFIAFEEDCLFYEKDYFDKYDNDGACNCTGGIGHLIHTEACDGRDDETRFNHMTKAQALKQLRMDIANAEEYVRTHVYYPLNQAQFDALVSMVFNMGFIPLDILQLLNVGDFDGAAKLFGKYIAARDGSYPPGLPGRRAAESRLFTDGLYGNEFCDKTSDSVPNPGPPNNQESMPPVSQPSSPRG
jgi:GH24 family phage-related lysozyme (muramidase)